MTIKTTRRQAIIGAGAVTAALVTPNVFGRVRVPEWFKVGKEVLPNSADSLNFSGRGTSNYYGSNPCEVLSIDNSSNTWVGEWFGIKTQFSLSNIAEWIPESIINFPWCTKKVLSEGKDRGMRFHFTFNSSLKMALSIAWFMRGRGHAEYNSNDISLSVNDNGSLNILNKDLGAVSGTVSELLLPENEALVNAIDAYYLKGIKEGKSSNKNHSGYGVVEHFENGDVLSDLTETHIRMKTFVDKPFVGMV